MAFLNQFSRIARRDPVKRILCVCTYMSETLLYTRNTAVFPPAARIRYITRIYKYYAISRGRITARNL